MKALICGYGRAGQRHEKLLQARGIEVYTYDKFKVGPVSSTSPEGYDLCVIATPPDQHLAQLRNCILYDVPVLVEKPLCTYYEEYNDVMNYGKVSVAYNYRYHPALEMLKVQQRGRFKKWIFHSEQHRPQIPKWGILLDHLPHTFDMLYWLSGHKLKVIHLSTTYSSVLLEGEVDGEQVTIVDRISPLPMPKLAHIICPYGYTDIETDPSMFDSMWDDFLAGNYTGLDDAAIVQEILNDAKSLADKRTVAI